MKAIDGQLVTTLVQLLGRMERLYNELTIMLERKLAAMRAADFERLTAIARAEAALIDESQRCEGARRQIMDRIGTSLGMNGRTARVMTVSQLCGHLDDAAAGELRGAASGLRSAMEGTKRANHVAGTAAAVLVGHLKRVWAAARPAAVGGEYTRSGRPASGLDPTILDAMG